MRIAIVIPYFYPAWEYGGQPRSAYELAKALVRKGHQVKVLTTDSGGRQRLQASQMGNGGKVQVDGIDVVYYRNLSNTLSYRYRLFWPWRMFRDIDKQLRDADVVHIHELRSTVSVLAYRAARRLSLPFVLSAHGGLRHLGRAQLKVVYDALWGKNILRDAAAVIAISDVEESDAKMMGVEPSRIARLPNIVDGSVYRILPSRGSFQLRYDIKSRYLVLFIGRLHRVKGADLLISAFRHLRTAGVDVHLAVVGPDDGQERELRELVSRLSVERQVTFTGFLNHESKLEALVDADLLVVPSRSEVFAIAAVEGLLCGTPILLSSACGLPLPGPSDCATFFRSGDVADLAAKLSAMLENRSLRDVAMAWAPFISRAFSAETIACQAEAIYAAAVAK